MCDMDTPKIEIGRKPSEAAEELVGADDFCRIIAKCYDDGNRFCDSNEYEEEEEEEQAKIKIQMMKQGLEEIGRNSKEVVEDEFDDDGRPRVKIFYVDPIPMDWSYKFLHLMDVHCERLRREEEEAAFKSSFLSAVCKGKYSKPPRLIFVLQDKDYWPGTASDPDAMRRRELKEKAVRECGLRPYGGRPDFKEPFLPLYEKLEHDYPDRYFNPDLPGAKFLLENFPEPERNIWKIHIRRYRPPRWQQQQQESSSSVPIKKKPRTTKAIVAKLEAKVTILEQEIKKLQKKLEV